MWYSSISCTESLNYNLNNNRCTPKDNCDNQLDVRGANDDYDYYNDNSTPVCMDSSQVCCHMEKLLKNVREEKLCSDIADDGYRYHLRDVISKIG